ncbi:hypothetical protein LCGC14_1420770, partial [marine sediment metagenome]
MDFMLSDTEIAAAVGFPHAYGPSGRAIRDAQARKIREWLAGTCPHLPFTWRRQCDKCWAEFS